ncbi:MAG: DUF4097 family beta strand repeat-containing protein [Candidatus Hydrogenedentota bacterium]
MQVLVRSIVAALLIAGAVQTFTVGVLSDVLPRDVCRPDLRTTWQETFDALPTLHITNAQGPVNVSTHAVGKITVAAVISAYVPSYQDREDAQDYLDTLCTHQAEGRVLRLTTEPRSRPERVELTVTYDVKVPPGTNVTVDASTGNIFIGEGCGQVLVRSHKSDIEIRSPQGSVMARTTNGRIDVYDAQDQATLRTVNGDIRADFPGTQLTANTVNGDIFATLPQPGVKKCDLTTTNGAIRIGMHAKGSAEVNAITREGQVTSAFEVIPLTMGQARSELRGYIGQAETKLTLSTFSGNIMIERIPT